MEESETVTCDEVQSETSQFTALIDLRRHDAWVLQKQMNYLQGETMQRKSCETSRPEEVGTEGKRCYVCDCDHPHKDSRYQEMITVEQTHVFS